MRRTPVLLCLDHYPWKQMSGIFPIDPRADLAPDQAHPGEYFVNNFVGDYTGLFAGVWSADAQETVIESYPVDEVCVVLAGTITLTAADGQVSEFKAGDAFAIRKGTSLTWANSHDVRKIYAILDHSIGTAAGAG